MKILFLDLTTRLRTFRDLETTGRGGMVSSLYLLPNALQQDGHECAVLSDAHEGGTTPDGVRWFMPQELDIVKALTWDVLVLNRQTYHGTPFEDIKAKHRILWVHDMVHGGWVQDPQRLSELSATVFMSEYSRHTWRGYYRDGFPFNSTRIIPNGVDKDLFYPREKDQDLLLYFSAPNRGLEHLPTMLDFLRHATGRDLKVVAFSSMEKMHPADSSADKWAGLYSMVRSGGIDLRDPVPQTELADWVGRAALCLKPNSYAETCSNVTLQALASGTPVVCGNTGADKEWVGPSILTSLAGYVPPLNGYTSKFYPHDGPLFLLDLCRGAKDLLAQPYRLMLMQEAAPRTPNLYTWKEVGQQWDIMLQNLG